MRVKRSDIWPPIQRHEESIDGYVAPMSAALKPLEKRLGASLGNHADFIDAEDLSDLLGFLEEKSQEAALPPPLRVVAAKQLPLHCRSSFPDSWTDACYVIWPEEAFQAWHPTIPTGGFIGPRQLKVTYPYFVATGAVNLLWILGAIGLAAWFLSR